MRILRPVYRNGHLPIHIAIARILRDQILKDYTIGTMVNVGRCSVDPRMLVGTSATSTRSIYKSGESETWVETALLVCALFLQRFALPFGNTSLGLPILPMLFILIHQFLRGKLLIQLDRLIWFLAVGLVAGISLLLNFKSTMLTSYSI